MNRRTHQTSDNQYSDNQYSDNQYSDNQYREKWTQADWFILAVVTLVAIVLRLYKLGEVPPGFQFDEAFNAIDAQQVLEGNRPLFLPANAGREVLYTYWQALVIIIYGFFTGSGTPVNVYTLRLASALGGIAAIPTIFTFLRLSLRKDGRLIAASVAVAQAINMWHIHFSHFGIRVVLMPVMFTLAFGLYWVASSRRTGRGQLLYYVLAGIATGLTVWNHPTGRFAPFVLIAYTCWLWITVRAAAGLDASFDTEPATKKQGAVRKDALVGLVVTGVVAFLVFLPLGREFLERPDFFFAHASDSSFLNEEVSQGAPMRTLVTNAVKVAGMFNISGDEDWTHNLPGRPVFDPLMSVAFLIGVFLWFRRLTNPTDPDRNLLVMLFIWLAVMLLPSVLSNDAPDYSRTMPSHSALMLAPGLGLAWLWLVGRQWSFKWVGPVIVATIVIVSAGLAFRDYFIEFASQDELYYAYDVNKLDTLNMLGEMTDGNSVYLSSLWADHATSTFLRGQYGIQSIETSGTLVLPPEGKGAVYAFPGEQAERADDLIELFPSAELTTALDPQGQPMLHVVTVDAETTKMWPHGYEPEFTHEIGFDDGPTLLGMTPLPKDGALLLYWGTDKKMLRDLTSFVHLLDEQGNKVGQADRSPGSGTYGTQVWEPGERVMDRYWPKITDPCASGAAVRAVVGWYQLADEGRRRARVDGVGDIALAGRMNLPNRAYTAEEVVPTNELAIQLNDQTTMIGFTLVAENLEPGAQFITELVWEGRTVDTPISLSMVDDDASYSLWNGALSEVPNWESGKRACRRLYLRVPITATAGTYNLKFTSNSGSGSGVSNGDSSDSIENELTEIKVEESTRQFSVPAEIEIEEVWLTDDLEENTILLRGFAVNPNSAEEESDGTQTVDITLIWQADSVIFNSYSAFVQALDKNDQIIAQSDAVPGGRQTNLWIPSEVVADTHTLAGIPKEALSKAEIRIVTGLYDPLTGKRMVATTVDGNPLPGNAIELRNN